MSFFSNTGREREMMSLGKFPSAYWHGSHWCDFELFNVIIASAAWSQIHIFLYQQLGFKQLLINLKCNLHVKSYLRHQNSVKGSYPTWTSLSTC